MQILLSILHLNDSLLYKMMYLWQAYDFETKKDGIRDKFLLLVLSYGVAFCALISRSKD